MKRKETPSFRFEQTRMSTYVYGKEKGVVCTLSVYERPLISVKALIQSVLVCSLHKVMCTVHLTNCTPYTCESQHSKERPERHDHSKEREVRTARASKCVQHQLLLTSLSNGNFSQSLSSEGFHSHDAGRNLALILDLLCCASATRRCLVS